MIPAFILREVVDVEPYEGETGAGGPSYGDSVKVKCHFEPRQRMVIGPNSRRVQSRAFLMCSVGTVIPPESRVIHNGVTYRAIEAFDVPGPVGVSHIEVALG